jgi:hypothetical protein
MALPFFPFSSGVHKGPEQLRRKGEREEKISLQLLWSIASAFWEEVFCRLVFNLQQ